MAEKMFTRSIKSTIASVVLYNKESGQIEKTSVIFGEHFKTAKDLKIACVEKYVESEKYAFCDVDFSGRIEQSRKYCMTLETFLKYAVPVDESDGEIDESDDD